MPIQYRQERNLVIYAENADEIAEYLNGFGANLIKEGEGHWCQDRGDNSLHICAERRHDTKRIAPDDPGIHGLWKFLKTTIRLDPDQREAS